MQCCWDKIDADYTTWSKQNNLELVFRMVAEELQNVLR
jgi:hypothetical protein